MSLPLSRPLLKWMTGQPLALADLADVLPEQTAFLASVQDLVLRRRAIEADPLLDPAERAALVAGLRLPVPGGAADATLALEDLDLVFAYTPASRVHGFASCALCPGGDDLVLTLDTAERYVELMSAFLLDTGVAPQLAAFRCGFDTVFDLGRLAVFSPEELRLVLNGESEPAWTRADLLAYTEPKYGYTRESPAFLMFLDVLLGLDLAEKRAFLTFATGCPTLPPGGLANLHPRLTVVRKAAEGPGADGSYPSVNTCLHYVKMPEYSAHDVMRQQLLVATQCRGFHLN